MEEERIVLRTEGLVKRYGKRTVVNNVSFDVKQGEIVGLLGPNGAGKTTSFYMTTGLIVPNGGHIYLGDEDVTKFPVYKRARAGIGYLAQEASVFRKMSVEDNILSVLEMTGKPRDYQLNKLEQLIAEFRLEKVRKNLGDRLSGGERRRTEIARCLAIEPKFIMLDEPFAGVDPIAVEDIQQIVYKLKYLNIGILITDHNVDETLAITDRAYLLFEGRILFQGTPEELAANKVVREKYLTESFELRKKNFEQIEAERQAKVRKKMKISFECADKINGLLTMTVEKADYQEAVEKTLKNYRKKAQVPGFRPGMVPMGMIKKQYGTAVKVEEVNKLLGEKLYEYVRENKIQMLGEPLPNQEKQVPQDFEKDDDLTFVFDIAVAPEFKAELTGRDKVDYYTIKADDKLIDDQVQMYASQAGEFVKAEVFSGNDTITGDLRELDENGNTKEGGIVTEGGMVMPAYIKAEDQKKLFDGAKPGDIITFNPKKAYPDNDAEVAALLKVKKEDVKDLNADFSYQITEIRHFQPAEVDQKLFDRVFGEGTVKDEKAFREKIAESIAPQLQQNSDYKFLLDVRAHMEKKVGKLEFPEALLKRVMLQNNQDKGADYVEKNFEGSIKELAWHLIKEQLVAANNIKVEEDDLKAVAKEAIRAQFAQYGMSNVPDDVLENYAAEQMKKRENVDNFVDRAVDVKLTEALKNVVKLNQKEVTLEEFNKLMQQK